MGAVLLCADGCAQDTQNCTFVRLSIVGIPVPGQHRTTDGPFMRHSLAMDGMHQPPLVTSRCMGGSSPWKDEPPPRPPKSEHNGHIEDQAGLPNTMARADNLP